QLSEMNAGYPAYRTSKAGLNALTRIFSEEFKEESITVNSACPGWVKTEMGGTGAEVETFDAVRGILKLLAMPHPKTTGGFYRAGERIDW
ncbi:MAG: SDR family NAD(P)-dependent oxidoreductase, partial [Bdellovibrionota bacterium]